MFTSRRYRSIVLSRLLVDLVSSGMANQSTKISVGLAAGIVYRGESESITNFMSANAWMFWSPEDIKQKVTALAERGYENDAAIITAQILMR